jgi:5-formyltetrahydrofolate cyclo-ligase
MKMRKNIIRLMIWDLMVKKGVSRYDSIGRIPCFTGSKRSAELLKTSKEWINSTTIFVSPDTAQISVRENVLIDGKNLIMASPKLLNGYILINPSIIEGNIMEAATINGAFKYGRRLENIPKVDMVVEGSVAVDLLGVRLGKGGGYGDREISFLQENDAIDNKTPLVTTVHEIQIINEVPEEAHDHKLNMLVTPERILRID